VWHSSPDLENKIEIKNCKWELIVYLSDLLQNYSAVNESISFLSSNNGENEIENFDTIKFT
jgi:hypothetical protein